MGTAKCSPQCYHDIIVDFGGNLLIEGKHEWSFRSFYFFIGQKGVLSGWKSSRKEEISELETVPGEMSPVPSIYMNIDF